MTLVVDGDWDTSWLEPFDREFWMWCIADNLLTAIELLEWMGAFKTG
jgi:hypothetical protein